MKPTLSIAVLGILICIAFFTLDSPAVSQSATKTPSVWDYIIEKDLKERDLNKLGAEGWELVAVTSTVDQFQKDVYHTHMFLKRPK